MAGHCLNRAGPRHLLGVIILLASLGTLSCGKHEQPPPPDRPRLTSGVKMVDVTFHSAALNRDMPYRAIIPATIAANQKLPVLYLLHGGGGGFHDWSNYSDVAGYAERGLILVMPEGNSSYYINSADHPQDRYEDYIVHDLIARHFSYEFQPVAGGHDWNQWNRNVPSLMKSVIDHLHSE